MNFNDANIDPDVIEFYRTKSKSSSQPPNRTSIPVSQQQQQQQQQHQQQQILYHQQMQKIQHNQQILKRQQPSGQIYYQKQNMPVQQQQLPINPQANKQSKVYRTSDYHPTSTTPHSSNDSNTNTGSGTSLKAKDLLTLLKHGIALLPGSRDKRGGPVLCFPANSHADELDIEDLYILVRYLTFLPDENVKKLKFSVVIDMRAGTTWHSVKPILKVLEECIGQCTSSVFIIKPEKFFEKQKALMASSKFTFDIQIVSAKELHQEIDKSQLTQHFDGTLPYSNEEWIEIRICLEDFFTLAHDMSDKFTSLYKFLDRKDIPETVVESKRRVEDHKSVRLKIIQAPVHVLEAEGDKLGHWLRYGLNSQNQTRSSWVTMNPDYQQLIPQVKKTVQQLYEYRAHLQHKWDAGRSRLEQIYQLRLFEDDIGRMSEWLNQQRHLFLTEYHDIGQTASQAADLYAEHRQFLVNCSDVREQVSRLTGVANMLTDSGHYASAQIQTQAIKLDHDWKSFTTALEDRSNVLQLSASFHSRAEAFLANCPHWETAMKQQNIQLGQMETVNSLNQYITTLQQLWQEARMAHEEVCSDGRALATHLSSPVPKGSHTSLAAAVDYSEGRKHCTHLMHEVWACFKRVETVQAHRYKRLTARLSLLMFREDVAQVLAWLNEHGEPFLKRQTSVGKSLQRAEQLYNAHMQFEEVAANTLINAEKLILAADELVSQAHDPEEILQEQTELERRIQAFTKAVENRRNTLDLAVGFHNHTKDLFKWFHQLKENHNAAEMLPLTIEGVEDELRRFHNEKRNILDAADKVLKEGSTLCSRLVEEDEKNHFKVLLMQVQSDKETATDLLTERQVRLDLCLQLRLFEADVASAIDCLKHEVPTPMSYNFLNDPRLARSMNELEEVTATFIAAIKSGEEVIQKGSELSRAFESVGVNFPAGGSGSNDSGVVDSAEYAVERIQRLSYELTDLVMAVDEVNIKLKIELDWRRLEQQSQQVLTWISQCDEMLRQTALVPSNLTEAEQLQMEHDKFQPILNEAHPQAVTCAAFAEMYIQQISFQLGPESDSNAANADSSTHNLTSTIYSRRKEAQNIAELVADQWQKLVYAAEEKHKLLLAAGNWYKTSDQVTSVLRSLEKEYRRAEDWCQNEKASSRGDQVTYLGDLLSRHFEQKEAFLKACILARRTSEQFIKYLGRQPAKTPGKSSVQEKVDASIKDLMVKEQAVLQAWAARKSRLDECLDFIRVKAEADELIHNFDEAGVSSPKLDEIYKRLIHNLESKNLNQHTEVIKLIRNRLNLRFANQYLLKPNQVQTGQPGQAVPTTGQLIGQSQPAKLRTQLSSGSNYGSGDLNRSSMSSTGSGSSSKTSDTTTTGISSMSSGVSQIQEKAAKKRIHLINEMIQTEIYYVNDLETYLKTYYKAIAEGISDIKIPQDLVMRKDVLFSNIKEILEFHKSVFLPEISQYDPTNQNKTENNTTCCFLPEDIGHCFIRYANDFKKIYVKYFSNKDEGNQIMMEKIDFFNELMSHCFSGEEQMKNTIQSFWIKPVQRITKYTIFLKDLCNNCDTGSAGELSEAWEVMLEMNKRINDEIHLKDIKGLPEDRPLESLGDFILMDDFTVWEPRQIIKKGRDRRVFLFDVCLVLTKKYNHDDNKIFYQYKSHILLTECNITEHIEGDQCKFALWTGRVPPLGEYRLVLKGKDLEIKQKWVRALRETMQERIFSFGPIYEENQRTRMTSSTSDVARNADNIFYVLDDFTALEISQLSVQRNQRVQLIEQIGEWASVRTIGTNSDIVDDESTKVQGLVPASLLISVSTRRYLVDDKSINGSSMKKWLRDRRHGPVRRGSKVESQSVRPIPTPIIPSIVSQTSVASSDINIENNLLDNVSEESVDVELPPPMALQEFPVVLSPNTNENSSNTSSNAPSSQTIDSNFIEPIKESQLEIHDSQESNSTIISCNTPIKEEPRSLESISNSQNTDHFSIDDQDKRASSLTIKEFTVSPSPGNNKASAFTSVSNQSPSPGCTLPSELDELGMALEKNLRLSRQARQENERYQAWQQHITSGQHTGTLDSISSKASKASQESERALSTSEMSQSSCSAAFPGLEEDEFDDSNHSPILIAPQILDLPGNGDEKLLGELRLSDDMNVAGRLWSPSDDEMVEDVTYNFISRRLLLYETGLILINEVLETCPSINSDLNSNSMPSVVRCKHILSLARLSIKEDVDMSEGRRSANKLLWFCLYEEVSSNQSVLCHIIDPITPDVRARWLTELTQMIQMEKSKQYANNNSLSNNSNIPNNSSNIGALSSANGSIASFNMASNNIKVQPLFQLKTDPIEIDFKAKSSSKLHKKSEKSLSSSKKSNKSDASTSASKKENKSTFGLLRKHLSLHFHGKYRISSGGIKKPR